jgi:transaldolase/glucose-6-phosphate isomerase
VAQSKDNPFKLLANSGQSVWLDSLRRSLIKNGELKRLIDDDGLRGMTSNPTIFEKAIGGSAEYDQQAQELLKDRDWDIKDLYEALAVQDIQDAADLFRPVYDRTNGLDGYVSLEVSPYLARDAEGTIKEARRLWHAVGRHNVMIKVPATKECIPAIRDLIAEGININITLLFAQERYQEVADAYLTGLELFLEASAEGQPPSKTRDLSRIASVASFFVSRIDALADTLIEDQIRSLSSDSERERLKGLKGKIAIANAKLAYQRYLKIFSSDRWHKLAARGARPQRLLWASTGVKNPQYRDTLYVDELIGSETVTTLPPATFAAFRDHGQVKNTLTENIQQAQEQLKTLAERKISLQEITEMLTTQAIELFSDPFDKLLGTLEKKRRNLLGSKMDSFAYEIPSEMNLLVGEHLKEWADHGKVRKLWAKDASVWTGKDESGWLGWLNVVRKSLDQADEIQRFAEEVRKDGFKRILLLGMGGSSLAPLLFSTTFPKAQGWPELSVLDSTHPDQILAVEKTLDLEKTLVVVSSKSGSTIEPNILYEYFHEKIEAKVGQTSGRQFVAITDPGSSLERLAKERSFRKVFHGEPAIGGRYSALSAFGTVPAALSGLDVKLMLERAELMVNSCSRFVPPKENPGVHLGMALGVLAKHGRNKVTFIAPPELSSLELWLEQLIAESTGKQGKGMIPVSREPLTAVEAYGSDRVFVYLKNDSATDKNWDQKTEEMLIQLQESGQPVFRVVIRDLTNIGQEFFRWEMATAVIGETLRENPFDQPDVESAKVETRALMSEYEKTGRLPADENVLELGKKHVSESIQKELQARFRTLFGRFQAGDFFAILAYLPTTHEIEQELEKIRLHVRNHMRVATSLQFGPRYLHSTGQAFKGGPNQGVFLVLTHSSQERVPIPGRNYDFESVVQAQALGDIKVMVERDRRVFHVDLGSDWMQSISILHTAVRHALHGIAPLNNQINTEGLNREFKMNQDRKIEGTA